MFVLRPAYEAWTESVVSEHDPNDVSSMFRAQQWAFNYKGLDGGGFIANGAAVDAFRLGMQYGLADAVMFGSNSVSTEGM